MYVFVCLNDIGSGNEGIHLKIYTHIYIYIHIYMYVLLCVNDIGSGNEGGHLTPGTSDSVASHCILGA